MHEVVHSLLRMRVGVIWGEKDRDESKNRQKGQIKERKGKAMLCYRCSDSEFGRNTREEMI